MEVECGIHRDEQDEIKLPERSSLVDESKKYDIPDTCDMCDQPSVWSCKEDKAVDCRRKVRHYTHTSLSMACISIIHPQGGLDRNQP